MPKFTFNIENVVLLLKSQGCLDFFPTKTVIYKVERKMTVKN